MIAQILAGRRCRGSIPKHSAEGGVARPLAFKVGVHGVRVAVAVTLLPALVVVASIGLVGAGVVALAGRVGTRSRGESSR